MLATDPERKDVHVRPREIEDVVARAALRDHEAEPWCWCQPRIDYEDAITQRRVYVHKKES